MGVASMSRAYVGDLVWMCSPQPTTCTGRWRAERATSSRVTTTAAPPATGITISSIFSGSATMREASTSSTVMGWPWNMASGWWQELKRWCTAMRASAASSQPCMAA